MVGPKFNHSPLWIVVEQGVEYDGSRQGELTFLEKWNYHSSDELVGAEAAGLPSGSSLNFPPFLP